MGWHTPIDWTVGQIVTEDDMDEQVRDNLSYLKGINQVPTIESGLIIDNTDGDEYVKLPLLSTAEAGTVLDAEGKIAFDETTHQLKLHNGTAVKAVISEADVDDTPVNGADTVPVSSNWAYDFQQTLTTAGDIPYATGAGVWARFAKGTANQYLRQNADASAMEWASGTVTDHTHQSAGAQGGQLDHGLALTGLSDNDHPQYYLPNATNLINVSWVKKSTDTVELNVTGRGVVHFIATGDGTYNDGDAAVEVTVDGTLILDIGAATAADYILVFFHSLHIRAKGEDSGDQCSGGSVKGNYGSLA